MVLSTVCMSFIATTGKYWSKRSMTQEVSTQVYKILSQQDWATARQLGYTKTALDTGDGYVHLSTREQVEETLRLHYKDQTGVGLFEFTASSLPSALKWEPSRGGQLFPHLYDELHLNLAARSWTLETDEAGVPQLPEDIDS